MYRPPTTVALRDMLSLNTRESLLGAKSGELRRLLCAVVDDFKALEWPPEVVLINVKEIAARAGNHPSSHFSAVDRSFVNRDELLARMTRWTIERYFRNDPPPPLGRERASESSGLAP